MKIKELYSVFNSPSNEYRMSPLLRINDEIDRDELKWQLQSMKEQGCGGVFALSECFHNAAPERFLSEWWWKVVRWVAELCAEEGLEFWAYDEEDWPSGSAGGQLLEKHPEYSWKYLHQEEHPFSGPKLAEIKIQDDHCIAVIAYQIKGDQLQRETITDLTDSIKNGKINWEVPQGDWSITIYTTPPGKGFFIDRYGDLMDRKAMQTFIDWVYEGHYSRLKDIKDLKFGGFFTDEPACSYSMIEWGERFHWYPSMPFSPELPNEFFNRHGYSWRENLPLLYYKGDAESLKYLCHYWETCCHLYSENYFGQIYKFCEDRGLKSSGHLVVEENFRNHLAQQAGNLPTHFRNMHIPGIDWIHPFENFKNFPATTPKYATSMAHLMGRDRTWCESFAAAGWGLTFQQMRWIVNWEHINGINMQIPICYKYSLRGPKRTQFYCPGISYQQPYWDHFRGFADYEARLCVLCSGGGHIAQIALAYPSVDIWSHSWEHEILEKRSEEYNHLGDSLRSAGYDFDILDDQAILEQSLISSGKIQTENETFEVLLFPRQDAVRLETIKQAKEIISQRGRVLFVGSLPENSFEAGTSDPQLKKIIEDLLGKNSYNKAESGKRFWKKHENDGMVGFAPSVHDSIEMLKEILKPDVLTEACSGTLFSYHRKFDDGDLYLFYNRFDENREYKISVSVSGFPERWNPVTGAKEAIMKFETSDSSTQLNLSFSAHEMIPIVLHQNPINQQTTLRETLEQEIPINGPFNFKIEETMLRPHIAWNFTQKDDGWTSFGSPINPPEKIPVGDWCQFGLANFSGIGHYETEIEISSIPKDSKVVLDLGRVAISAEVIVNYQNVGLVFFEPYQLDISNFVCLGTNRLIISVANTLSNYFSQFAELSHENFNMGGDIPERRVSGLIGPVSLKIFK